MKQIFTQVLILLASLTSVLAQHTLTSFPSDLQLYPRDTATNLASIPVEGSVTAGHGYDSLKLYVYRDGVLDSTYSTDLTGSSPANFTFNATIPAELNQYRFQLVGVDNFSVETTLATADSVVAGDVYLIYGQSNAEAPGFDGSANAAVSAFNRSFIRTYGSGSINKDSVQNSTWRMAEGDLSGSDCYTSSYYSIQPGTANIGQWAMVMADQIVEDYDIPVVVINGAYGGAGIAYLLRNDSNPTVLTTDVCPITFAGLAYGRWLYRIMQAGLDQHVRGIFWYQGEQDATTGMSATNYRNYFDQLYNDWLTDFPGFESLYLFQIRTGCSNASDYLNKDLEIQQALLDIANDLKSRKAANDPTVTAEIRILGTQGLSKHKDACHFTFSFGYETLGEWVYQSVANTLYGASYADEEPPQMVSVGKAGTNTIVVTFDNTTALTADAGAEAAFKAVFSDASTVDASSISIVGNEITLGFPSDISAAVELAFYDSRTKYLAGAWIKNGWGMGILNFRTSDFTATFPVEWLSFDGAVTPAGVQLEWQTATEVNSDYFEIERSLDARSWQAVGLVQAGGNRENVSSYSFVDSYEPFGTVYYRLRQVDFDGSFSFSSILEVTPYSDHKALWSVFPNPTNGEVNLIPELDPSHRAERVAVVDLRGKVLHEVINPQWSNNRHSIDLGNISPGVYLIQVESEEGIFTGKVVKQ